MRGDFSSLCAQSRVADIDAQSSYLDQEEYTRFLQARIDPDSRAAINQDHGGFATVSIVLPTLERRTPDMSLDTPSPSSQVLKPQRVLACVTCQQRKVKCDRKFPCANCIKSQAQCVPATLAQRRRRRRLPERVLLERLRTYEDLLRQNNIAFEPLHKSSVREREYPNAHSSYDSDNEHPDTVGPDSSAASRPIKSERGYEAKYALFNELVQHS